MNNLFTYTLRLADNALVLGQRLSEWTGHGPFLEEDLALTNIALDTFGAATSLLEYAAKVENKGRFRREADSSCSDWGQFGNFCLNLRQSFSVCRALLS